MKQKIIFFIIVNIAALLQTTVLNSFKIFNVKPDIILISIVLGSLSFELSWAIGFSIFAGILKDVFSLNAFGINTILFPIWSFLIIRLSKKITLDNGFICAASVAVITVVNNIFIKLINFYLGNTINISIFLPTLFLECLYTALVLPLVFKVVNPLIQSRE